MRELVQNRDPSSSSFDWTSCSLEVYTVQAQLACSCLCYCYFTPSLIFDICSYFSHGLNSFIAHIHDHRWSHLIIFFSTKVSGQNDWCKPYACLISCFCAYGSNIDHIWSRTRRRILVMVKANFITWHNITLILLHVVHREKGLLILIATESDRFLLIHLACYWSFTCNLQICSRPNLKHAAHHWYIVWYMFETIVGAKKLVHCWTVDMVIKFNCLKKSAQWRNFRFAHLFE